jgi:hypothetical protein
MPNKTSKKRERSDTDVNNGSKKNKKEESDEICSICLEDIDLEKNGLPIVPTKCGHIFHEQCLVKQCYIKEICPICRKNISKDCNLLIEKIENEEEDIEELKTLIEEYSNLSGIDMGAKPTKKSKNKKHKEKKKNKKKKKKKNKGKKKLTKQR